MRCKSHVIPTEKSAMVILKAPKGFVMCAYLDIEAAQNMGDAAAMVRGVKTKEDALCAKIVSTTEKARQLGVKEGMTGAKAIELMQ